MSIEHLTLPALQSIEATGVKFHTPDSDIIFIAAYKVPTIPLNIDYIRHLSALGSRICIAGDLNSKHSQWNSRIANTAGKKLYHAFPRLPVTPIATTEPTHFHKNGGRPDDLDMALVKEIAVTDGPHAISALDSDHIPVLMDIY